MPQVIEPTLIRTSTQLSTTAGAGATQQMDFDFGNLEGALLLAVEYRGDIFTSALSGGVQFGLHFNGTQAAPATSIVMTADENLFGYLGLDHSLTTSGAAQSMVKAVDLRPFDIVIARNIAFQIFVTGASTLGGTAAVFYKRAIFSQAEVGGIVAFRR